MLWNLLMSNRLGIPLGRVAGVMHVTRFMMSQEHLENLLELNGLERKLRNSGAKGRRHAELEVQLAECKSRLPTALVSHHERLIRGGRESMAPVTASGGCASCLDKLPVGTLAELCQPGFIAVCPHCGSFVFKEPGSAGANGQK